MDSDAGHVSVADGRLYYERSGQGPALVLIHPGFLDRRLWDPEFARLAKSWSVVRYDVRGFGRSSRPTEGYSDTEDLKALLDHLGIARPVLIGHSMGARIAADFLAEFPDRVPALVLVAGVPGDLDPTVEENQSFLDTFPDRGQRILTLHAQGKKEAAVDAALSIWAPAVDDATRAWLRPVALENHERMVEVVGGEHRSRPAPVPVAGALRESVIPILFLGGSRDHPALCSMMARFAQQVRSGRYVEFPGADHTVSLSARTGFEEELDAFLRTIPPAAVS